MKGIRFRHHRVAGEILELAQRYRDEGADELVFYDITASPDGRSVDKRWINQVASLLDIPFCVAGGLQTVEDVEMVLNYGADKISINTPALNRPSLINELVQRFGSQCIVVSIDSLVQDDQYRVHQFTGDPDKSRYSGRLTLNWVTEVQDRGAGEIVLNCMNQDGVRNGYDIEQLAAIREASTVPLIASGGAGTKQHFFDVFRQTNVDGALAASVFHSAAVNIGDLKQFLTAQSIEVRP